MAATFVVKAWSVELLHPKCYVVGNIYENPELLREDEDA
jgi:hypothetical protein